MRYAVLGSLFYVALLADLHQPMWGFSLIHPSFVDACFLLACQICGAAGAVFWGGIAGLLDDVIHGRPPGQGILLQATIGLAMGLLLNSKQDRSLFFSLLISLFALLLMTLVRSGALLQLPASQALTISLGQLALTFLAITTCSVVISMWNHRRSDVAW